MLWSLGEINVAHGLGDRTDSEIHTEFMRQPRHLQPSKSGKAVESALTISIQQVSIAEIAVIRFSGGEALWWKKHKLRLGRGAQNSGETLKGVLGFYLSFRFAGGLGYGLTISVDLNADLRYRSPTDTPRVGLWMGWECRKRE